MFNIFNLKIRKLQLEGEIEALEHLLKKKTEAVENMEFTVTQLTEEKELMEETIKDLTLDIKTLVETTRLVKLLKDII
jgi:hypothetical protein